MACTLGAAKETFLHMAEVHTVVSLVTSFCSTQKAMP